MAFQGCPEGGAVQLPNFPSVNDGGLNDELVCPHQGGNWTVVHCSVVKDGQADAVGVDIDVVKDSRPVAVIVLVVGGQLGVSGPMKLRPASVIVSKCFCSIALWEYLSLRQSCNLGLNSNFGPGRGATYLKI